MKILQREKRWYFIIAFMLLSIVLIWMKEPQYMKDTIEYTHMYAYLPPLYPLFLHGLKFLFGEILFPYVAVFIQTVIAAWIVVKLWVLLCNIFVTEKFVKNVIFIFLLLTYFKVDEYSSNCNLWILTEGLSYSLFYVFTYYSIIFLRDKTYSSFVKLTISMIILTLCRTQFLICVGMLMLYIVFLFAIKKINIKKALNLFIMILTGVIIISLTQSGYEQVADRTNINMFHKAATGAHLYYYAEREDANKIEDEEERQLFLDIYEEIHYNGYGYKENQNVWLTGIKSYKNNFSIIQSLTCYKIKEYVMQTGIQSEAEIDEMASQILGRYIQALESHFWLWAFDSFKQFPATFARVVALYYEPLYKYCVGYAILTGGIYLAVNFLLFIQMKKLSNEIIFSAFLIIFTFVNIVLTQMTIRSIMRYVSYSFGLFYISGLLVFSALIKRRRKVLEGRL